MNQRRNSLFERTTGRRYWGGTIAGIGLGCFLGYAARETGLLSIKAVYLAAPCIILTIVGQLVARGGSDQDRPGETP